LRDFFTYKKNITPNKVTEITIISIVFNILDLI